MPDTSTESKRGRLVSRRPLAPGAFSYRIPDAASMIGVSSATMWRIVARGDVEARKIGTATVIRAEDLKAYLDGTTVATKAAQ